MADIELAASEAPNSARFRLNFAVAAEIVSSERPDRVEVQIAPVWPDALPKPTLAGYGLKPAAAVNRVPVDQGAPRVYRRTRRPLIEVTVVWQVDGWQQMLLDGFHRSKVEEGGAWFGITLAFPSGLSLAVARFKGRLAIKALGGDRWQVGATLELQQRPVMSEAALTALLGDGGEDPAWPEDLLPLPLTSSWELQPQSDLLRSEDMPGLAQQRRRSRNATTEVSASWELSAEQAALFDGFFCWRGKGGAQWFGFPVYGGIGFAETKVRFLGEVDWTPRGAGRWAVTAPIEIRERAVLSAAEMSELSLDTVGDLLEAMAGIHQIVTEELQTEED